MKELKFTAKDVDNQEVNFSFTDIQSVYQDDGILYVGYPFPIPIKINSIKLLD